MVRRPQSGERIQGLTQLIGFPRVSIYVNNSSSQGDT